MWCQEDPRRQSRDRLYFAMSSMFWLWGPKVGWTTRSTGEGT